MKDFTTIISLAGLAGTVCAMIFGYVSIVRNKKSDDRKEGKQDGAVMTELGYIKSGVDDIKRKQEQQEQQHIEVITRITAVEESVKQAHHRLDELKK